eukprot:9645770-Alexandrium_andersonii.AAC.1
MSASLVGSEMCIRDRGEEPRTPSQAHRRQDPRRVHACHHHGEGRARQGAVSYTHLTLPTICSV